MLRSKRIPARVRCGFGTYLNAGFFEDHVVCEFWDAAERRWLLVDPQFDEVWRKALEIDHDVLNVPRDRFLIAAVGTTGARCVGRLSRCQTINLTFSTVLLRLPKRPMRH
jgi:transglutaminase-like putative cysteine protease